MSKIAMKRFYLKILEFFFKIHYKSNMIFVGSPFFYITLLTGGTFLILGKRFRSISFRIVAVNIVLIFLFFSLFDTLAVKMFTNINPFRILDNYFHHTLKPFTNEFTTWDTEGKFSYLIKTNSLGFVDSDTRVVDLKKKRKRIMFIGDSFIEGVGYPWEETVAGMISGKLKNEGVELLNASVASYSPKLYWLKTEYFLKAGLEIDELFVFVDISDVIDEVVYDYFVPQTFSKTRQIMEPVIDFFSKNSFVYRNYRIRYVIEQDNPYRESSEFWGGIKNFYRLKPEWIFNEKASEMYGKKGIELAKKHMDNLHKLCKKNNIKLTIAVWPWQINLTDKHDRKHLHIWKNFTSKRNIDFIQMYDLFESIPIETIDNYFIPKDIHWSREGNIIVSEYLWQEMNKTEKKEPVLKD